MVYLLICWVFQKLLPSKLHLVPFRANSCSHWVDLGIIFPRSPRLTLKWGCPGRINSLHHLLHLDNGAVVAYSPCCSRCAQFLRAEPALVSYPHIHLPGSSHNSFWSASCFQLPIQAKQNTYQSPNPTANLQHVLGSPLINTQPYSRPSACIGSSHSHWLNTLECFWIHH